MSQVSETNCHLETFYSTKTYHESSQKPTRHCSDQSVGKRISFKTLNEAESVLWWVLNYYAHLKMILTGNFLPNLGNKRQPGNRPKVWHKRLTDWLISMSHTTGFKWKLLQTDQGGEIKMVKRYLTDAFTVLRQTGQIFLIFIKTRVTSPPSTFAQLSRTSEWQWLRSGFGPY